MNPAGGMINYGPPPPPVPYAAVPVTVPPIPLVGVPTSHHPNTDALAMIAATHLNPAFVASPAVAVTSQDPVLLAAQGQGYAEVRGGVTYFHPQASVSVRGPAQVPILFFCQLC
jgi:hypothetical protein